MLSDSQQAYQVYGLGNFQRVPSVNNLSLLSWCYEAHQLYGPHAVQLLELLY
jgi:hypothetical protein